MELKDLDRVGQLRVDLDYADAVLQAFEEMPGPMVPTQAVSAAKLDFGRKVARVDLLPVEKSVAVSAARREREKIVNELRQLGVTVE